MKLKKSISLSIRIIAVFVVAIFTSLIPENYPKIFGDYVCNGTIFNVETKTVEYFYHLGLTHKNVQSHWGYRHYLWMFMGLSLFVVQIVDIISIIDKKKE